MEPIIEAMDAALTWSEAFAIGHEALDADHRRIIGYINEICAAVQARKTPRQLRTLLSALNLAAEDHFTREDVVLREMSDDAQRSQQDSRLNRSYLKAMSDAALDKHRAEHALESARLRSIILAPHAGIDSAGSELCADLKDWFLDHTMRYDEPLKAIFQAM